MATYYVRTDGVDIAGRDGLTTGAAWATLSYAASRVSSGDHTIYINSGSYTDNNRVNLAVGVDILGNASVRPNITTSYLATGDDGYIRMYSASNIDGNNTISYINLNGNSLASRRAIYAENRNNTIVHHCNITTFLVGGVYLESEDAWDAEPSNYITGCSIYDCTIDNCADRNYEHEGNIRATACHELMVYNNSFTNNARTTSQNGNILTMTFQRGSKFYNNTFTKGDHDANGSCPRCWNFFVELFHPRGGVEFYDNTFIGAATLDLGGAPGQGAFIQGGYGYTYSLSIHDNTFNTSTNAQLSTQDGGKNHIAIDLETNLEYIYVYNNHIKNYPTGIGMVTSTLSQVYDQNHVYIFNNLIENVGYTAYQYTYGIYVNNEGNPIAYSGTTDNLHIWNNTITGGSGYNYKGIICHLRGTFTNSSIKNNIIYDFDTQAVYISRQVDAGDTLYLTDVDVNYNNFYSNGTDSVVRYQVTGETSCDFTTGNITTIPGLDADWTISSISSAVYHTGINVGLTNDIVGTPWNTPPSMGCYEFVPPGVAPVANFSADTTTIYVGDTVTFTDSSTNTPTSWSWDFGDSGTSTQQNPSHTFSGAGSFTVSLTATNAYGSDIETKVNYIVVETPGDAPIAEFIANVTTAYVGDTIYFTDQSLNTPTSWSWNFGESGTSTLQNPTHIYSSSGVYTIILTATNAFGNDSETKIEYITILDVIEPIISISIIGLNFSILNLEATQYVYYDDGVVYWRKGCRGGSLVLDKALTVTGFAGTEDIDWENVRSIH